MKKKNKAIASSYPQHHHQQNQTLLFIFFCILVCYLPRSNGRLEEKDAVPAGHGYRTRSVSIDPSGKSLTAYLGVINSSSIFGPDIQNLNFIARLYMVRCGRFLWPFLHRTRTFGFLKTRAAAAAPEERFSGNIGGGSSRRGGRWPPVYRTHIEKERSKTKIKPRKLSFDF